MLHISSFNPISKSDEIKINQENKQLQFLSIFPKRHPQAAKPNIFTLKKTLLFSTLCFRFLAESSKKNKK